jgi:hypothetical protein
MPVSVSVSTVVVKSATASCSGESPHGRIAYSHRHERTLARVREGTGTTDGRAQTTKKGLAAIETREQNLTGAVAGGETPEALIAPLEQEQACRKSLETKRAGLAERRRLAALRASEVISGSWLRQSRQPPEPSLP